MIELGTLKVNVVNGKEDNKKLKKFIKENIYQFNEMGGTIKRRI